MRIRFQQGAIRLGCPIEQMIALTRPSSGTQAARGLDLGLGNGSGSGQGDHGDKTNEGGGELHFDASLC